MNELKIQTEAIRFLRASGKKSNTDNIVSHTVDGAVMTLYCDNEYPVMLHAVPGRHTGDIRPKAFELTLLHGAALTECGQSIAEMTTKLLGVRLGFLSTPTDPTMPITMLLSKKEVDIRAEHVQELDTLKPGYAIYRYLRIFGVKNRRILVYQDVEGKDIKQEIL